MLVGYSHTLIRYVKLHMPYIQSKTAYLRLAVQCDELATSARTELERMQYRNRAAQWRQLANARVTNDFHEKEANFVSTAKRKQARKV
jgi:hypothetical protein